MAREEELLSWNLMAVGGLLNKFIFCLIERLGWKQSMDEHVARMTFSKNSRNIPSEESKEQTALVSQFLHNILAPLELLDSVDHLLTATPTTRRCQYYHPLLIEARDCLIEFFTSLDPTDYQYFSPYNEESDPTKSTAVPLFVNRICC
jgi:hypothetical protein